MEQTVVLVLTRSEFDKLATGWFVAQQVAGPCTCDTCEGVNEVLADAMEELLVMDELEAEIEALEDLLDQMKSNAQMNLMLLTNSHPQFLITQ